MQLCHDNYFLSWIKFCCLQYLIIFVGPFIFLTFFAKFVMLISTHRRYHIVCTVLDKASVAATNIFLAHKKLTSLQQDGISDRPHNLPLVSQDFGGLLSCKLARLLDLALGNKASCDMAKR